MSQLRQGSRRATDGPSRERPWRQETSARPILCFREFAPRFLESGGAAMRLHTKEELHPRRAGLPGLSVILLVFYYQQDLGSSSKVSELLISGNLPCTQLRRVPSVPMSGRRSRRDRLPRQESSEVWRPRGRGVRQSPIHYICRMVPGKRDDIRSSELSVAKAHGVTSFRWKPASGDR